MGREDGDRFRVLRDGASFLTYVYTCVVVFCYGIVAVDVDRCYLVRVTLLLFDSWLVGKRYLFVGIGGSGGWREVVRGEVVG